VPIAITISHVRLSTGNHKFCNRILDSCTRPRVVSMHMTWVSHKWSSRLSLLSVAYLWSYRTSHAPLASTKFFCWWHVFEQSARSHLQWKCNCWTSKFVTC